MPTLFPELDNGAIFSECGKYRFVLWRKWDAARPMLMFIGLNPSTANQIRDDNTITKVKKIAYNCHYGGVYMLNLFAYVTPYPKELRQNAEEQRINDQYLIEYSQKSERIVFAWGRFKEAQERAEKVMAQFPNAAALGTNQDGSPCHPLFQKDRSVPMSYQALKSIAPSPKN